MTTETFTTSYGTVTVDAQGYPAMIERGPRCGACKAHHKSVADIRYCYDLKAEQEAQVAGELAAEKAVERHFEDRGYWEARADEDREAAMGIVPFHEAMAEALGQLDPTEPYGPFQPRPASYLSEGAAALVQADNRAWENRMDLHRQVNDRLRRGHRANPVWTNGWDGR